MCVLCDGTWPAAGLPRVCGCVCGCAHAPPGKDVKRLGEFSQVESVKALAGSSPLSERSPRYARPRLISQRAERIAALASGGQRHKV